MRHILPAARNYGRPIVTGLVALAAACFPAAPASAGVQPASGASTASTTLEGVACATAKNCWAVGQRTSGGHQQAMIERLRAGRWVRVTTPQPSRATAAILDGVACVRAADCWAVGSYIRKPSVVRPVTEHWNGHTWKLVPAPVPTGSPLNGLYGVSCVNARNCMAVGQYLNGTLTERWNGRKWLLRTGPSAGEISALSRVSCPGARNCWAAGYWQAGPSGGTITAHWNGASWSIATTATENTAGTQLTGVSCHGASSCFTVGSDKGSTLTERWAGSSWSVTPSPNDTAGSILSSVSCPSRLVCLAVGSNRRAIPDAFAERWNGSSWSIVHTPSPASTGGSTLSDVACVGPADCWAVGTSTRTNSSRGFAEHWNGKKWSLAR